MGPNHWQVIHHASWLIKQSSSNHCWITNHPNNQSCELVDWTMLTTEWIIHLMSWLINPKNSMWFNHCQIINHACCLIKQSLSNHCWIINHTNNQSCGLVDWTRLTTRMKNMFWWVGGLIKNNKWNSIIGKYSSTRAGWLNNHCRIIAE